MTDTTKKTTETKSSSTSLTEEIKTNVRRDREVLGKLQDKLSDMAATLPAEEAAMFVKGVTFLAEAMVHSNSQLVELAKIDLKRDLMSGHGTGSGALNKEERKKLFEEIDALSQPPNLEDN
jgi:hypothetical protein